MNKFLKKCFNYGLIIMSLLSVQGCALTLLDWITPSDGYKAKKNIAYGSLPRQKLDVYTPVAQDKKMKTILFFYGGAWQEGSKNKYRFVAQALTNKGYQVIIPDYRVYPEVLFPGFMEDSSKVLAWVDANLDQPIVLMGHSAGAHIAALLAFDKSYSQKRNIDRKNIIGFIGLSGPYDFLPLKSERLKTIFNGADNLEDTQPINFVDQSSPPSLLLHGLEDTRVLPFNTEFLAKALTDKGVSVEVHLFPEVGHANTVGALSILLRDKLPVLDLITQFVDDL